jgi:hypothetical protein
MNPAMCILLLLTLAASSAWADSPLQHDPFVSPITRGGNAPVISEETPWSPNLTTIMVAGKNSVVTIDGVTVRAGETINGYRFDHAHDHQAVFFKGKKRIVLNMETPLLKQRNNRGR